MYILNCYSDNEFNEFNEFDDDWGWYVDIEQPLQNDDLTYVNMNKYYYLNDVNINKYYNKNKNKNKKKLNIHLNKLDYIIEEDHIIEEDDETSTNYYKFYLIHKSKIVKLTSTIIITTLLTCIILFTN